MKMLFATLASLLVLIPSASHSKYQRPVQVSAVGQNYVDVDELIWNHARRDLGDLRLAAGDAEVPYAIVVQHGSSEEQRTELPVLQQTSVGGKTQFLIDISTFEGQQSGPISRARVSVRTRCCGCRALPTSTCVSRSMVRLRHPMFRARPQRWQRSTPQYGAM